MTQPPHTVTVELDLYAWTRQDEDAALLAVRHLLRHWQIPDTGAHIALRQITVRKNDQPVISY